jgi:CRP-like cAMP-binding protein
LPSLHSPKQNHLLAAMPAEEFNRLLPHLELVPMPIGEVLYESGGRLNHVYFPTTSIVSLLYVLENGASAEIAIVGNEGILGISIFMGGETTPSRAVVQSAGFGFVYCFVIRKHLSRKCRKQRSAIGITRSSSSCVAGCC